MSQCEFCIDLMADDQYAKEGEGTYRCSENGSRYMRTKLVCDAHKYLLQLDNKKRIEKGEDIPCDTSVTFKLNPIYKLNLKKIK